MSRSKVDFLNCIKFNLFNSLQIAYVLNHKCICARLGRVILDTSCKLLLLYICCKGTCYYVSSCFLFLVSWGSLRGLSWSLPSGCFNSFLSYARHSVSHSHINTRNAKQSKHKVSCPTISSKNLPSVDHSRST